ncbi:cobalt transport protein CbiM [Agrilactobacillus composti DSM 18527 = JCM 14202]|uniref:Cobalt transport protein CbiM n=1 Tax=Agrilactobacillus composti DSM 18527 = JCM 14202 TaxID=1423734 RepID=A0A0R1XUR0_9LACO|nr:cobalt transporter CbiM [Agrilactobacillus composti]KRM30918.1 cobalt transport protein CbiM [Agrilactobacillus composti DSM 18527 = JCM 14202]
MHIPDNYLSPQTCGVLLTAMAPIWIVSLKKVKTQIAEKKETIPLVGICAALAFLVMMFNVPIPGGTTAHAVGGTILAILIGPWAACLALSVTLFIQAFLFGDGGILAFGANAFNMAFLMPFIGYGIFKLGAQLKHPKTGAFVGAYVGINFAALMAGIELGIQPLIAHNSAGQPLYAPYGLAITIPAMLFAHLVVAGWIESLLTLFIYNFVAKNAPQELYEHQNQGGLVRSFWIYLFSGLALLSPLGLLASGDAFGEWDNQTLLRQLQASHISQHLPSGMAKGFHFSALFSDYTIKGLPLPVGYILAAVTAIILILLLTKAWSGAHERLN